MTTITETEVQGLKEELRELIAPTHRIYFTIDHVSRSGMMRHISFFIACIDDDGRPMIRNISWYIANILEYRRARGGGLVVSGCGMDMGFSVIYQLGSALFPQGFKCLGKICGSNDHANIRGCDRVAGLHHHPSGGYAIKSICL